MQDLLYAWRSIRRSRAFAAVAIVTLALGIGSTTATFSVVDGIVLRGLPYKDAHLLSTVYERNDADNFRVPSYPQFLDLQAQTATTRDVIEGFAFVRGDGVDVGDPSGERRAAAYVSPGFFQLMGTQPALGRTFAPDEEKRGASRVAVISWELFVRKFGGDPSALGKTLAVDSVPTVIIGVMPYAFAYPNFGSGGGGWIAPALWQPIAVFEATNPQLSQRGLHVDSRTVMRVRAGVDSARAAATLNTIERRLAADYPAENARWTSVALRPLSAELYGDVRSMILTIAAAITLVLLLACANVANLMLVRGGVRASEMALRVALGASRWRLARQLLAESLVLATSAGALGLTLAAALVAIVKRTFSGRLPFAAELQLDARMAAFALLASLATAVLVGVAPAIQAGARDLMMRLRRGVSGAGTGKRERLVRHALVSVQFGLAILLLISAGLLLQSFRRMASVPLGFDPDGVIEFAIGLPSPRYEKPADASALYARVLEELRALPGVSTTAAAGGALLLTPVRTDQSTAGDGQLQARYHPVSTDYLQTMRFPLLEGRWFTEDDMRTAQGFVVNERLARRLAPRGTVLGTRITVRRSSQARADFGQPITLPVIGVVGDMRQFGPTEEPDPEVFLPYTLEVWPWMRFDVRAANPERMLPAVERAVRTVEPGIEFRGKPSVLRSGVGAIDMQRRFMTFVLAGFAVTALFLAAVGLYSIVTYGVVQRTREIGVRIALGAPRGKVVSLVLRESVLFVIVGAALGLLGAFLSTRVVSSLLFQTAPTDLGTFLVVPLVLGAAAIAATFVPARRATRLDPMSALRSD
jgi:putative ABC transport system permease protein